MNTRVLLRKASQLYKASRKFNLDTVVAHQYRDQLDDLNRGSTLNVGNLICFRVNGVDGRELASQFDNTPPEPELERQSMIYPTSREGVYRTGDRQEYILIPGKARLYTDVQAEMSNRLSNLPPFTAYCKLTGAGQLEEHGFVRHHWRVGQTCRRQKRYEGGRDD